MGHRDPAPAPPRRKPVDPGSALLEIYVAMVIGDRSKTRDFSDQVALDRCKKRRQERHNLRPGLGRSRRRQPGLTKKRKHRTIIQQLRGMPIEMLDKTYNLCRIENHGINLDDYPEYRTYQTFYEMGIAPPTHQEMADIIIQVVAEPRIHN